MSKISKMESEIRETPEVLERLVADKSQIHQVVERIESTNIQSVMIAARGTSDNAAHFLKQLIEVELGIPVGLASPSVISIYKAKLKYKGTLAIALSQSGQSPDLVAYIEAARQGGGLTLAVTNDSSSPLAGASELHLNLLANKEISVAATKTYTAQLFASLLLVLAWKGSELSFTNLIEESRKLLERPSNFESLLTSLNHKSSIVVLGRGFSYGNAKELALKIQETSQIAVQGMSAADYMHGPIAAVDSETKVLVLSPNGARPEGLEESVSRLRKITKHLIWIGDSNQATNGELSIPGSKNVDEKISTILDATIIQMIACKFAIKNGLDPDSPKGLSKVTFTL